MVGFTGLLSPNTLGICFTCSLTWAMIRKSPPSGSGGTLIKRARSSEPKNEQQIVISSGANAKEQGLVRTVKRTSGLDVSS
jgi:hypothetical protein